MKTLINLVQGRAFGLFVVLFLMISMALGGGWLLTRSSFFQFSHMKIEGVEREGSHLKLKKVLGRELGKNLFALSMSEISESIREIAPEIQSVSIKKVFPATLHLSVKQKFATMLELREKRLWVLDSSCRPYELLTKAVALPLLSFEKSDNTQDSEELRENICQLAHNFHELVPQSSKIKANSFQWKWRANSGLILSSHEDEGLPQIELGFSNFKQSLRRSVKVMSLLQNKQLKLLNIDGSYASRVIVSLHKKNNELNLNKLVRRKSLSKKATAAAR